MYYINEYGSTGNLAPLLSVGLTGVDCVLSQDNLPTEEEYTDSRGPGDDSEEEGGHLVPRILYDNSAESEQGNELIRSWMIEPHWAFLLR